MIKKIVCVSVVGAIAALGVSGCTASPTPSTLPTEQVSSGTESAPVAESTLPAAEASPGWNSTASEKVDGVTGDSTSADAFVGTWKLVDAKTKYGHFTEDKLESSMLYAVYWAVFDGKNATLSQYPEKDNKEGNVTSAYSFANNEVNFSDEKLSNMTAKMSGDKLIIEDNNPGESGLSVYTLEKQ